MGKEVTGAWNDPDKRFTDPEDNPIHLCSGCPACKDDIDMERESSD